MSSAMYLEHYLDSLEGLPADLERNFNLIRELDQKVQSLLGDAESATTAYLAMARSMAKPERLEKCKDIAGMYSRGRVLADEKVQLAMQTYEMVDKHIRRLDTDLARFESELKERTVMAAKGTGSSASASSSASTSAAVVKSRGQCKRGRKRRQACESDDGPPPAKRRPSGRRPQAAEEAAPAPSGLPIAAALTLTLTNNPSEVLDMPVDPNEPTYCLCHQVSYGDMIGCDNNDCPIEWFHFGCVGLAAKPKGKWYCPKCLDERKPKK